MNVTGIKIDIKITGTNDFNAIINHDFQGWEINEREAMEFIKRDLDSLLIQLYGDNK